MHALQGLETAKFHSEKHVKAPFDLCFLERGFHCNLPDQGMNWCQQTLRKDSEQKACLLLMQVAVLLTLDPPQIDPHNQVQGGTGREMKLCGQEKMQLDLKRVRRGIIVNLQPCQLSNYHQP
jgi:hypothetical protein